MINMGELFAHDRIGDIEMELVPVNDTELSNMLVKEGDLLFARQSLVLSGAGKCSIVKQSAVPTTFESHIIRVRLNKNFANPDFYHYYFKSPRSGIKTIVTQGVQAGIRSNDLKNVPVPLPSLSEQVKIADILSNYDYLIENNQRRIALLEEAARMLYREWFVRFRFPGHEHVKIIDGLPEGWGIKLLSDLCRPGDGIQTGPFGSQLHQSDYTDVGVPVVMPKDLIGFRIESEGMAQIPEELADRLGRHRMEVGDIVYGRRGDIGRRAFIGRRQAGWFCGTGCLRIRPDPTRIAPRYLFETLGSHQTAGIIANQAKGSTMPNLSAGALQKVPILYPPAQFQRLFMEQIDPMFELVDSLFEQNQKLAQARDLLLPRLMNGEIPA
jgi:type I restriction enzyme S subunit